MSDELDHKVTHEELNKWLNRDRAKQRLVADRIFVSERTIDGWRHGGTIPDQYHKILHQMMHGEDSLLLMLPPETVARLAAQAKRKGFKTKEAFIAEILKTIAAIALFATFGHQVFHHEDNQPRRFGRRRHESVMISAEDADGQC